jgi:hypothetical protein
MEFSDFVKELLHLREEFGIVRIDRHLDPQPCIYIGLKYRFNYCEVDGFRYSIYDYAPERT